MFEIILAVLTILFLGWILFTKLIPRSSNKSRAELLHDCDIHKDADS
jgi:hypothetical protein